MRQSHAIAVAAALLLCLGGCSEPTPDPEEPLEPQATAAAPADPAASPPGALRATIEEPLDKAKAVDASAAEEEAERQRELEEIGG